MSPIDLVAIGASWGGLTAIERVLEPLPADFPAAVVIVQHRQTGNDGRLVDLLAAHCALNVSEAEDKQALQPGMVLVAPPDYHMLVEPGAVALSIDERVHFSRPSVDVLLHSVADAYGDRAAAIVLTGANADGAAGLARIVARGGTAIVQEPETAERREMPAAALAAVPTAKVVALDRIGQLLVDLVAARAGARS
jgi:two-component system chemotaxis response regulator CheB